MVCPLKLNNQCPKPFANRRQKLPAIIGRIAYKKYAKGPELVDRVAFHKVITFMMKAFGGALSLALTILVLRLALPEVAQILIAIITKSLMLVNAVIGQINLPQQ